MYTNLQCSLTKKYRFWQWAFLDNVKKLEIILIKIGRDRKRSAQNCVKNLHKAENVAN